MYLGCIVVARISRSRPEESSWRSYGTISLNEYTSLTPSPLHLGAFRTGSWVWSLRAADAATRPTLFCQAKLSSRLSRSLPSCNRSTCKRLPSRFAQHFYFSFVLLPIFIYLICTLMHLEENLLYWYITIPNYLRLSNIVRQPYFLFFFFHWKHDHQSQRRRLRALLYPENIEFSDWQIFCICDKPRFEFSYVLDWFFILLFRLFMTIFILVVVNLFICNMYTRYRRW